MGFIVARYDSQADAWAHVLTNRNAYAMQYSDLFEQYMVIDRAGRNSAIDALNA